MFNSKLDCIQRYKLNCVQSLRMYYHLAFFKALCLLGIPFKVKQSTNKNGQTGSFKISDVIINKTINFRGFQTYF